MIFVDSNNGWLVGSVGIINTTDGGGVWTLQNSDYPNANKSVYFTDSNNGWAVGDSGSIISTGDGGSSWAAQSSGTNETLRSVVFADAQNGWAAGDNSTIIATTDGGSSWTSQSSGTYSGNFHEASFINSTTGMIAGENGAVFKTTDGGSVWTRLNTGTSDELYFVFFLDANNAWAGGKFGTIIHTSDGGDNWILQSSSIVVPFYGVHFSSERMGWTAGMQGEILYTFSGGEFIRADFDAEPKTGINPLTVQFEDKSTGKPTSYLWSFGDGETSTDANPEHTYNTSGSFTITLTIESGTYTDDEAKSDYIFVDDVLTADFDAEQKSGSATFTVDFTDQSTSSPDSWLWEFGDGASSASQNPSHTYETPGFYDVTLTVENYQGESSTTKEDFIEVYEPVNANFSGSPRSGAAPLEVNFQDESAGRPETWNWNFGDGNSSEEKNPAHTYQNSGTYTVTLTVSDGINEDSESKRAYINVTDDLNADFTASPTSGELPLNVSFTDQSRGGATMWSWKFGDGGTSTEQNPVYTYELPGEYDVELTISDGGNNDKETKFAYITVTGTPQAVAEFSAAPTTGEAPLTVDFTDESAGGIDAWSWDFGDGNSSDEQNPTHIYADSGTYDVSLTVSNGYNEDQKIREAYIYVYIEDSGELIADFEADPRFAEEPPLHVDFTDKSTGEPTSWRWDFGDENEETTRNPIHSYWNSGTYTVTLTVENEDGETDEETKENYIIVEEPISVQEPAMGLKYLKNYPNPFSGSTVISYSLDNKSRVKIDVLDAFGRNVASLIDETQSAGEYFVVWNADNERNEALPSGAYYYRLRISSGDKSIIKTGKMLLIE